MKTLKTFATAEEGHLAASLLESAGIQAFVVEDRALGGNLLATTSRGVRIELDEADFAQAEKILEQSSQS
ncbi:MAG: putative signal transducing protein [Verrucomicrobiales bacterium]